MYDARLWSLWDMLRLPLNDLTAAVGNLMGLVEVMMQAHRRGAQFSLEGSPMALPSVHLLAAIAAEINLPVTKAHAVTVEKRLVAAAEGPIVATNYKIQSLIDAINDLNEAFKTECMSRVSLVLAPELVGFYEQADPLFGEGVSLKFGKVASDISEAGKCLALERPTACVFHLMRVVEFAVKCLGKKLKVAIDVEKEGWYQITLHINKAIDLLPTATLKQRKRKQGLGAAAAHLNSVRIATRNDVMHPKASYTLEEARTLFDATRTLVQQMAKIV